MNQSLFRSAQYVNVIDVCNAMVLFALIAGRYMHIRYNKEEAKRCQIYVRLRRLPATGSERSSVKLIFKN